VGTTSFKLGRKEVGQGVETIYGIWRRDVHHFRANPLRVVVKSLHIMTSSLVYKLT